MNLLHLRTFLEVIRAGSFAEAARTLSYTPSAVSQQIAALESDLGTQLFERIGRRVMPTSPGLLLAERGLDALERLDNLRRDVSDAGAEGGRIRVGAFPSAAARLVPQALRDLHTRLPRVNVAMVEGEPDEILPALLSGSIDLALVYTYTTAPRRWPDGLIVESLMDEQLYLLVGHGHRRADADLTSLTSLASESWISIRAGSDGDQLLHQLCGSAGFQPRINYRCNDYEVIRELVKARLGIALVTTLSLVPESKIISHPLGEDVQRQVLALRRESSTNPVVGELLASLGHAAQQHAELVEDIKSQ